MAEAGKFYVKEFTDETCDINGVKKPTQYIGHRFMHTGNVETCIVVDVVWIGDIDEWGLVFIRKNVNARFVRSMSNFLGIRRGQQRFER